MSNSHPPLMTTTKLSRRSALASLGAGLGALALPAWSQAFPARPLRVIVPQPPGGGFDFVARQLGERLAKRLGHPGGH